MKKDQVTNNDMSNDTYNGEIIDHYNIDDATTTTVSKIIMDLFNSVKKGENKTFIAQ